MIGTDEMRYGRCVGEVGGKGKVCGCGGRKGVGVRGR